MDVKITDALNDENGAQRSSRSLRLSSNGKYPASTYSPRELARTGGAADATSKFASQEHHSSPPTTDALNGVSETTGRPSRRIKPVRLKLSLAPFHIGTVNYGGGLLGFA